MARIPEGQDRRIRRPRDLGDVAERARLVNEYKSSVQIFSKGLEAAKAVSVACSGRLAGARLSWASVLFTRICVLSASYSGLLAETTEDANESEFWDLSSSAGVARIILECCLLFYYLGVENVPHDLWRDRVNLMHLHDCTARAAMFRTLLDSEDKALEFDAERERLVERLESSDFLQKIPERQRKHLLRGDRVMFEIQDDVLARMKVDIPIFRAWYSVLSAHVHTYPLAFHRNVANARGAGVENGGEMVWIASINRYVAEFLARATTQMLSLFPDVQDPRLVPGGIAAAPFWGPARPG